MKKILVLNKIDMLVSFKVLYSLPKSKKTTEIKSGKFPNPLFRIIEIPENATNIIVTISTVDSKGKKKILGEIKQTKAIDLSYGVYKNAFKVQFKEIDSAPFKGACSFYGVNNSNSTIRVRIIYVNVGDKTGYDYDAKLMKKGDSFAFVLPSTFEMVQIKVDKAKDIKDDNWKNIFFERFTNKSSDLKSQRCYEISKPLFKSTQCRVVDCSNI